MIATKQSVLAPLAALLLPAAGAIACPVCDTDTGAAVRAGVFDGNFVRTVLATVSPFPVMLGVVAAIHYGWVPGAMRSRHRRSRSDAG